jgi:DNA-binding CsgD family transcriptional regulator
VATSTPRTRQLFLGAVASPLARLVEARLPDEPAIGAARAEGERLDVYRAVAYATRSRGRRARPRTGWASLTPTEREVVALTARGLSNAAIGHELLISPGTVRTHLRSVFSKLGVTSRTELAARAARRGI